MKVTEKATKPERHLLKFDLAVMSDYGTLFKYYSCMDVDRLLGYCFVVEYENEKIFVSLTESCIVTNDTFRFERVSANTILEISENR